LIFGFLWAAPVTIDAQEKKDTKKMHAMFNPNPDKVQLQKHTPGFHSLKKMKLKKVAFNQKVEPVEVIKRDIVTINPDCNLIIKNWSFINGNVPGPMPSAGSVNFWTKAYKSPDVRGGKGCNDMGYISMWGNQANGEAIQQQLSTPIVQGHRYRITLCVRNGNDPNKQNYVRFRVRASNSQLNDTNCPSSCAEIGTTPSIFSNSTWTSVTLPIWMAPDNYNRITISATNDLNNDHAPAMSYGHIDKICLVDLPKIKRTKSKIH
jgi:hypothetical protein